jgi:hypothetical protein
MAKPTEEQIRQRAQEIWEENHRPTGRDEEFWLQAEKELQEKKGMASALNQLFYKVSRVQANSL